MEKFPLETLIMSSAHLREMKDDDECAIILRFENSITLMNMLFGTVHLFGIERALKIILIVSVRFSIGIQITDCC